MSLTIYLIRHTTPAIGKGICYGQSDLDVTASFPEEAAVILQELPGTGEKIGRVYSSPLQRCSKLAARLFPATPVSIHDELKEIHCGDWEMRPWEEIPKAEIDPWMSDFVQVRIPGGESYLDLYGRVISWFNRTIREEGPIAIVTHGGVIRSILSWISSTPLTDSFNVFSLHYGCTIRLRGEGGSFSYEILSNIAPPEKEQHKPVQSTFGKSRRL